MGWKYGKYGSIPPGREARTNNLSHYFNTRPYISSWTATIDVILCTINWINYDLPKDAAVLGQLPYYILPPTPRGLLPLLVSLLDPG